MANATKPTDQGNTANQQSASTAADLQAAQKRDAERAQAEQNAREKQEREQREKDEADRQERQRKQQEDAVARGEEARANMSVEEKAAMLGAADATRPYGHPDPAPGAAGYEAPRLEKEPDSVDYHLAHPGALTSGTIDRDAATSLKSAEEAREEREANNDKRDNEAA